jgi:hypothetical protein
MIYAGFLFFGFVWSLVFYHAIQHPWRAAFTCVIAPILITAAGTFYSRLERAEFFFLLVLSGAGGALAYVLCVILKRREANSSSMKG